jgi:hypothetical protein
MDDQSKLTFTYDRGKLDDYQELVCEVVDRLRMGKSESLLEGRQGAWAQGWNENLENLVKSDDLDASLKPKYFRDSRWLRFRGELISLDDQQAESKIFDLIRHYLFLTYCSKSDMIAEFGCGSGYNLLCLARLFPGKQIRGYDWVEPSVEIANLLGSRLGADISGSLFDMTRPDWNARLPESATVVTIHAMEQLGDQFQSFVEFLLREKVSRVVHLEPICELYNPMVLLDCLALIYHRHRNYLWGYLANLQKLEASGKLIIEKVKRIHFGSRFHEAYTILIWRPAQ